MDNNIKEVRKTLVEANKEQYEHILNICRFTDKELNILSLKYQKGFTLIEIAENMNYSEINVKKMHNKILKKIEKAL